MEIGEIINDAIRYPSSDWTKVIVLGILTIIPIVNFLATGYLFRILKSTFAGFDELPDMDEWGNMFIDGLKILVVGIVYAIPVLIIGYIIYLIIALTGYAQPAYTPTTDITGFLVAYIAVGLVYIILAIIIGLIESIAIANMALYDSDLGAAFKFSEILERISMIGWSKYIVWYIVMILLGLVFWLVSFALGAFTFGIGFILVILIIAPFFGMFAARSLALLFASSEETVAQKAPETAPPSE